MAANTGKFYREIEDYINNTIASFAREINNVESVRSARKGDHIFMELTHEDSTVRYFDCTAFNKSNVGLMFSHIMANDRVAQEITDREAKKSVRRIFRQERSYD